MYSHHKWYAKKGSHKLTSGFYMYCTYQVRKTPFNEKRCYYWLLLIVVMLVTTIYCWRGYNTLQVVCKKNTTYLGKGAKNKPFNP